MYKPRNSQWIDIVADSDTVNAVKRSMSTLLLLM